jgi:O-antigen/teichoic acid export membrane protein
VKRPIRNALAFLLGDAGSRLIGFVITVYLARVLSPEGFGLINIGLAVLGHLGILASPGISLLETRNVAAAGEEMQGRASGVLILRLIIAAILCSVAWLIVVAIPIREESGRITLLYVASLLPMAISLDWFFTGKERVGMVSVSRLLNYAVYGFVVFFMVRSLKDAPFAPAAFLAGNWAASIFLLVVYSARFGKLEIRWQPSFWWKILKDNLPVGAGMFLGQLVVNLPPLVLAFFAGAAAVGRFSAASKIVFLFLVIDRLFNTLFLPVVSRYLARKLDEVRELYRITVKGTTIVMAAISVAGALLAPLLMRVIYGPEYEGSYSLLERLMAYVFLTVVNSVFVCTILGAGRTKEYLRVTAIGGSVLAAAVGLGTLLMGEQGTTLGVVLGEASVVGLSMIESRKIIRVSTQGSEAAIIIGTLGILLLPTLTRSTGPPFGWLAGAILVVVVLFILGGITRNEIRYLVERLV